MQQQDLKAIGSRIRQIRSEKNLKQIELAQQSGVHVNTLSNVETGKTPPTQILLDYLAKKEGYSIDWVLTGIGKQRGKKVEEKSTANLHAKIFMMDNELKELRKIVDRLLEKENNQI